MNVRNCPVHCFLSLAFFVTSSELAALKMYATNVFFVMEAKLFNLSDYHDVRQPVYEMYVCGKFLRKKIICGALTNGYDWIFLLIKSNDNYDSSSTLLPTVCCIKI